MSSRCREQAVPIGVALLVALGACDRETRDFRGTTEGTTPPSLVRVSPLQPGPTIDSTHAYGPYEDNAYASSEGQHLFSAFNCSGCHANGGGGMGPPLMDDTWIYGSQPDQIYRTIIEGRPNGMPSFGGRIAPQQVWQLVAYVRSLSGLTPSSTRSARPDHMMYQPGSQTLLKPEKPKQTEPPRPSVP
jgi:cytochrome c oxidase cbb3-type subunit 3